ncbi:MAG: RNA polymerase sporulation sigma factor SigK [Lachnospiraceae bacterium]|nr:RNA polymerase sporulation sigma factor SigK [Lachnospiraceae bacterium]
MKVDLGVEVFVLKSFPKPLTAKEESILLEEMCVSPDASTTELIRSKEARDELIERNLRLVAHIVKKYSHTDRDMEDLISIGTIGLIKAVDTYNAGKGIRLATYASRCIDNELLMMLRSSKKRAKDVYLSEPIGADKEGNEISLLDICTAPEVDIVEDMALREDIKKLYGYVNDTLTEREEEISWMRYGLGNGREMTQRELAEQLYISRSYVSRIEKKALHKLREKFEQG